MLIDTPKCPSGCIISYLRQYPDYPENKQRQDPCAPLDFSIFIGSPEKS